MRSLPAALLAIAPLVGCPAPEPPRSHAEPPHHAQRPESPPALRLAHRPELAAAVRAPASGAWNPESLGAGGLTVALRMQNVGAAEVDVRRLAVSFAARRDGVDFPCAEHVGGSIHAREPAALRPSQAFDFVRDLDCTLSLPGRYDVRVFVRVGDEPADFVGSFDLLLQGGDRAPRAYPPRPGLYAMMTGAKATKPLSADAWARGDYHVSLAVINGGAQEVTVGNGKISFLVYKKGSPLPCSGQAEEVTFPDKLAPGAVRLAQAPVACAPSEEGSYEIVGRLSLGGASEEVEIGRVGLLVTRDPMMLTPTP